MEKSLIKKCIFIFAIAYILAGVTSAHAYVLDGDLSDWGVTPFISWNPTSPTVDFTIENNYNTAPSDPFYEPWDLEAMYFDNDADYLYFAVVTSSSYRYHWASEDLGLSFDGDTNYEFGADIANSSAGLNTKDVWSVDSWRTQYGIEYRVNSGTKIGTYSLYNHYAGAIEPGVGYKHTYILEGRIDRLLFGDDLTCGSSVNLQLARVTCLKDYIRLSGDIDGPCGVVPEPTTMVLFGVGLFGIAGRTRFRRKNKK